MHQVPLTVEDIQLRRCKPGKARRPDGIEARELLGIQSLPASCTYLNIYAMPGKTDTQHHLSDCQTTTRCCGMPSSLPPASPSNFAKLLFTIQHYQMIRKLHLSSNSFLSNRQQRAGVGIITSSTITTNTGAPQGCVLSPFLFTLYTNACTSPSPVTTYIKYSADTQWQ